MTALHVRYRPKTLDEVVGQDVVVKALTKVIEQGDTQTFLFCGPSGCGKTTLARIVGHELGCQWKDLLEIDGATATGIDAMRVVQETLKYRPFGKSEVRMAIVDEAHMLSKSAWNSILKATEEPSPHVYWAFCTTEPGKVPPTIKTRAATFTLKSVPDKVLGKLFDEVCEAEKIELPGDIGDLIITEAKGSPRQMLVNLAVCRGITSIKEARTLLQSAQGSEVVLELCRFLAKGGSWQKAMSIVTKLEDENPEGVRIIIANYFGSVAKGARSDQSAAAALSILDCFSTSYNQSDGKAPLLLSIGRALLAE